MGTKRRWTPRLDPKVEYAIKRLVEEVGLRSPAQVQEALELEKVEVDIRTIRSRLKLLLPPDESGPWTLADATEAEAAAVIPVLSAVLWRTQGRARHLTRDQAALVCRVRAAAPELAAWCVWETALAYWRRSKANVPCEDLDAFLAFAPWLSPGDYGLFLAWVDDYRSSWLSGGLTMQVRLADGSYQAIPMGNADGTALAARVHRERLSKLGVRETRIRPFRPSDRHVLMDPWEARSEEDGRAQGEPEAGEEEPNGG